MNRLFSFNEIKMIEKLNGGSSFVLLMFFFVIPHFYICQQEQTAISKINARRIILFLLSIILMIFIHMVLIRFGDLWYLLLKFTEHFISNLNQDVVFCPKGVFSHTVCTTISHTLRKNVLFSERDSLEFSVTDLLKWIQCHWPFGINSVSLTFEMICKIFWLNQIHELPV